ncbi:MAG: hypothetical protein II887_03760 [Bacteroidales bacterium]|nr:hypothetical protein [Bacteroidales bacterium]
MKKHLLTAIAVLCLLTTVKAQNFINDFTGMYIGSIPGVFTTNGHPYLVAVADVGQLSVLDGNLNLIANVTNDTYIFDAYYMDADASAIAVSYFHNTLDHDLLLTQNLYNSDDEFEFLEAQWISVSEYSSYINGISIKSSNGATLQTIYSDEGWHFDNSRGAFVLKIDNNFYLVLREEQAGEENTKHVFYLIKQNQGLTQVDVDLPLSVFPTTPNRNQQITVELGEGNNATEITIVNSLGQVVKRVPIEEGQRTISIPARELGCGLNVVNAHGSQGQGSCKIIVR